MWCEITERKAKGKKQFIRLEDADGNEVNPKLMRDAYGNLYTAVYTPENAPFFEIRPKDKMGVFRVCIEVLELD